MYISDFKRNPAEKTNEEKTDDFFARKPEPIEEPEAFEASEEPEFPEDYSRDTLIQWRAPEFEVLEKDKKWYWWMTILLTAIVGYAIFTNGPIMAITFILIGVVGYVYINKEPRILDFRITYDGVMAGRELFPFESIKSFWIFYEPQGKKIISLETGAWLNQYISIPIHDADPLKIREILKKYVPESKHEPGWVDALERVLKI